MCLSNDGSMAHLINSTEHGLFFNKTSNDSIVYCLRTASKLVADQRSSGYGQWRECIRRNHAWLGYDCLAKDLLARLDQINANSGHRL